jgi:hypothetical protein
MIRHCAEPRCPVRIDSRDAPWYYCDEHRTEDKEADHAHDYATSMIEASRERADEIIRFLETVTDERHPALQDLAQTQIHEVRCLEDALYFEPSGTVAMYALLVGSRHMRIEAYLTEKGLHGRIEELAPDARIGKSSRTAHPDGRTPQGPTDDVLRDMVRSMLDRHPGINRRRACEKVRGEILYKPHMIAVHAAQMEGRKKLRPEERLPSVDRMYKRTEGVRRTPKK